MLKRDLQKYLYCGNYLNSKAICRKRGKWHLNKETGIFYIMFCSLRESHPEKSTEQLLFEFYQEMQEDWLNIFSMLIY